MLKVICATKCSNNQMHPQIHSQDSLHFTLILTILRGASSDSPDPLSAGSGSPDPLVVGSVSPDPKVVGFDSPDPLVVGSVSPDTKVASSGSPDPLVMASSRLTSWVQYPLRAGGIYTFSFSLQRLSMF